MSTQQNFKRYEKKYLINEQQYQIMMSYLNDFMTADDYGISTICNIYYDTLDYRLIRTSLEKPIYKEKLRLRTYGIPKEDSVAYIELKKKYKGIVYKRRMISSYKEAYEWLNQEPSLLNDSQIEDEICWFRKLYNNPKPAVVLCYDRLALFGNENKELRVTFDSNIRWRTWQLDLTKGDNGSFLLPKGMYIMEIKIPGAMPLWMSSMLDKLKIYPTSFSKYGRAYQVFQLNNK